MDKPWKKKPKKKNVTTAVTKLQYSTMEELCSTYGVNTSTLLKMGIHLVSLNPELAKEVAVKYQRVEEF